MNINIEDMASRVQLCTLSMKKWQPNKLSKAETAKLRAVHGTDAARVMVTLCDAPELDDLTKLHNAARSEFNKLTLPAVQDGFRIVPMGRQIQHAETMAGHERQITAKVAEIVRLYPEWLRAAPARLNGLFDPSAWPTDIDAKFGYRVRYMACPTMGEWGEWLKESALIAQSDLQERFRAALVRVVERCGSGGKLHETVFTGLSELCELVPDMDLSGKLAPLAQMAAPIGALDAEVVRGSDRVRADAAAHADRILGMMGGIS